MHRFIICLTALLILNVSQVQAQPENPNESNAPADTGPPTTKGKVTAVEEKGKLTVLKVTDESGNEYEFLMTPLVKLEIRGTGDPGFVRPGQFVTTDGVVTNDQLFAGAVDVLLLAKGKRPPLGKVSKSARQVGASTNSYDVSGVVIAKQQSPDYPEYEMLALKVGGKPPVIMLKQGYKVNVVQTDPAAIPVGADIEMLLAPLRGGKFKLVAARVTLPEELKSDDVLGALEPGAE